MVYAINKFDQRHKSAVQVQEPIGPHRRTVGVWCKSIALEGYPGWHMVHMHGDYVESVDCSTRDVMACFSELVSEWRSEVLKRFHKEGNFDENMERDVVLLQASLAGGLAAVRHQAMMMSDFSGGPDMVQKWMDWISHSDRWNYRAKVAAKLEV